MNRRKVALHAGAIYPFANHNNHFLPIGDRLDVQRIPRGIQLFPAVILAQKALDT